MPGLRRRIIMIAVGLASVLLIGTVGFVVIEDFPWFDALYMSVTTISTVGYMEVHPLHTAGRVFNTFLILIGVSTLFFAVGVMTQSIIELELTGYFPKRRMKRMIEKLNEHYIACGFGPAGTGPRAAPERARASS